MAFSQPDMEAGAGGILLHVDEHPTVRPAADPTHTTTRPGSFRHVYQRRAPTMMHVMLTASDMRHVHRGGARTGGTLLSVRAGVGREEAV